MAPSGHILVDVLSDILTQLRNGATHNLDFEGWAAEQWVIWGRKKSKLASTIAHERGALRASGSLCFAEIVAGSYERWDVRPHTFWV